MMIIAVRSEGKVLKNFSRHFLSDEDHVEDEEEDNDHINDHEFNPNKNIMENRRKEKKESWVWSVDLADAWERRRNASTTKRSTGGSSSRGEGRW